MRSAAAVCLAACPAAAWAGGAPLAPGDGSWASNPALFSPVSIAEQRAQWVPADRIEDDNTLFGLDWSLGARASYIHDSVSGDRYQATFSPSFSFEHTGTRLDYGFAADGQLTKTQTGFNVDDMLFSGTSTYEFSPEAKIDTTGSLEMTQEDPHAPDVPSTVLATPVEVAGKFDTAYTQQLGRFSVALKGNAERDIYGPTTLTGGTTLDNTAQNNTSFGGGLRLGFALTPILTPFLDAEIRRTQFDAASPTLLTKLDGNQASLMAGLEGKWDRFQGSASAGVGLERFDNPALADVEATLFDANLTYAPSDVLSVTADFTSAIGAPGPNGSGTAQVSYVATAEAKYLINEWLDARASAGWHDIAYAGTANTDTGYDLGVGADYLLNEHLKLNADYGFSHAEVTGNPGEDTQTVSVGLTVQK